MNNKIILQKFKIFFLFGVLFIVQIAYGIVLNNRLNDSIDLKSLNAKLFNDLSWSLALFIIVFIPILEETIFRLWLNGKRLNIKISLVVCLSYLLYILFAKCLESNVFLIIGLLSIASFLLIKLKYTVSIGCSIISISIFGFMHIGNFLSISNIPLPYIILILTPFWFFGSIVSFLRLKFGFVYSVSFHVLNNLLICGAVVYFKFSI